MTREYEQELFQTPDDQLDDRELFRKRTLQRDHRDARVLALLKRVEWNHELYCPECVNLNNEGHATDCELAALIRELESA